VEERIPVGRWAKTDEIASLVAWLVGPENTYLTGQKIVIDPNGGAGAIAKKILEQIGVISIGINMQYGEFNRKVEPTEDSLIYLKNIIDEKKADFAAGFDCDADRVEILLGNGQLLSGNYILALIVNEILSTAENPERQFVVVNSATSNIIKHIAEKFGAKLREAEAGEANVLQEMGRCQAIIGGEGSNGGVIIPPSKCRDGILTLLMLLSIAAKKEKILEYVAEELPKYCTLRKNITFNAAKHNAIRNSLKEHYSKKGFEIRESGGIKGSLKVITGKDSFVWFRASKTESDIFRIISDSGKKEEAERLMEEGVEVFDKAKT
jgi:phosphomannomutase